LERCRMRVLALEREVADGLSQAEEAAIRRWLVRIAKSGP
jgi:hypothetical protein